MGWIKERYSTLGEAAGPRKYIYGLIFAAVVSAVDRLEVLFRWAMSRWLDIPRQTEEPGMIFGFPSWIVGITIAFALLWWWTLEYAVRLRRRLNPSIDITFEGTAPWVHPVQAETSSRDDPTKKVKTESTFVRFKVENTTPNTVIRGCEVFLIKISWKNERDEFVEVSSGDSFRLPWSAKPQDKWHAAIPIPYGINTFCDLLYVDKEHNSISVLWDVHLNINLGVFSNLGVYRFDVLAISERGGPVTKSIYLDWSGQWDQIKTWTE